MSSGTKFAFDYPTESLKKILFEHYIKKAARWLTGGGDTLHATHGNAYWEAAFSMEFLDELSQYLDSNDDLYKNTTKIRKEICAWLLSNKEIVDNNLVHWDNVTWDSAIVLRCLLRVYRSYNEDFSGKEKKEIDKVAANCLVWLFLRFFEWESQIKYPFGDADIAQILITATIINDQHRRIFNNAMKLLKNRLNIKDKDFDMLKEIAIFLMKRKTLYKEMQNTGMWEDFFQTAEVLESLTTYYILLKKNRKKKNEDLEMLRNIIFDIIHTFEIGQTNSMWGSNADTCRALYSYVKCCKLMDIEPENQIVFKSLRWLCDKKQSFKDGSFYHTSDTIYYSQALLEVYQNWALCEKKITEVYDDVVWYMEASTSFERGKRLLTEKKNRDLLEEIKHINHKNVNYRKSLFISLFVILAIIVSTTLHYFKVINALDLNTFSILVTIALTIATLIWSYETFLEYRKKLKIEDN